MQNLAQLEKNLKEKDLSVFKVEPMKLLAKQVVQYQNFKFSSAKLKINRMSYSEISVKNYFYKGIDYIKNKKKDGRTPTRFFDYIDFWLSQKLQPLTPSEKEKALIRKRAIETIEKPIINQDIEVENATKPTNISGDTVTFFKKIIELQQKEIKLKDEYIELYKSLSEVKIEKF